MSAEYCRRCKKINDIHICGNMAVSCGMCHTYIRPATKEEIRKIKEYIEQQLKDENSN